MFAPLFQELQRALNQKIIIEVTVWVDFKETFVGVESQE
jgi:hypothetical protein